MFDQAMGGWDVRASLTDRGDVRALRILGVRVIGIGPPAVADDAHEDADADADATILAVSRAVYDTDPAVRDMARAASREGRAEVVLWGGRLPGEPQLGARCHTACSSAAARVYKSHAIAAARGLRLAPREMHGDEHLEVLGCPPVEASRTGARTSPTIDAAIRPVLLDASIERRSR
ncbi:hypothetical protein AB0K11_13890 [Mycobacterium sp. NPDC050551]|uniref:hypothetical protein n=1 Tax=Mycobacterium sp. NPDC050551 TaxID=3155407 RepID=UPI003422984B